MLNLSLESSQSYLSLGENCFIGSWKGNLPQRSALEPIIGSCFQQLVITPTPSPSLLSTFCKTQRRRFGSVDVLSSSSQSEERFNLISCSVSLFQVFFKSEIDSWCRMLCSKNESSKRREGFGTKSVRTNLTAPVVDFHFCAF